MGRATEQKSKEAIKTNISIHALRGEGDKRSRPRSKRPTISIHALRGEGDLKGLLLRQAVRDFNPRPPWGGRLVAAPSFPLTLSFQSTPSVGRATFFHPCWSQRSFYFNPRPPWGGRLAPYLELLIVSTEFQSTPSVGRATMPAINAPFSSS